MQQKKPFSYIINIGCRVLTFKYNDVYLMLQDHYIFYYVVYIFF